MEINFKAKLIEKIDFLEFYNEVNLIINIDCQWIILREMYFQNVYSS